MQLETLINNLPLSLRRGAGQALLDELTDDSRSLRAGSLFIARAAAGADTSEALRYVSQAVQAGAGALLLPDLPDAELNKLDLPDNLPVVTALPQVAVDQRLCGTLAERFFGEPSKQLKLLGVTGTNGKTTTVTIAKHLLDSAGHKCGLIGTVAVDTGSPDGPRPAHLTTPGAIELSRLLAQMVKNGCKTCVMEVSSHALHQGRTDHLRFAAAAFTNLTQDHLDYHGDMQSYADAKAILFEGLDSEAFAVINGDDTFAPRMARNCQAAIVFTAVLDQLEEEAPDKVRLRRCCAAPVELTPASTKAQFIGPFARIDATVPMPGLHNLSNALQAMALVRLAANVDPEQIKQGIETCKPVPGRLEPVGPAWPHADAQRSEASGTDPKLPTVLVDYAHTPDALHNVGKALRELTQTSGGKLITVFGCGGDRDRAKRPLMAQAAQQHADVVVLTSDNPRTEDPEQILDDTAKGFINTPPAATPTLSDSEASGTEQHIIADRAEAIRTAILELAKQSDTVLIAGKGHEDYQIIGTTKHPFDDREHAAAALRERRS